MNQYSKELVHGITPPWKKAYNKQYYLDNKDKWKIYEEVKAEKERSEKLNEARKSGLLGDAQDALRRYKAALDTTIQSQRSKASVFMDPKYSEEVRNDFRKSFEQGNKKYLEPRAGDVARVTQLVNERKYAGYDPSNTSSKSHMRTSVAVPKGSAGSNTSKVKRAVNNALNTYMSAYKAGVSDAAKKAKDFINKNQKAIWYISPIAVLAAKKK